MTNMRTPCPAERPSGISRVTWWRARKRGYLTVDYHRGRKAGSTAHTQPIAPEDARLLMLLRRALRLAPRRLALAALARQLGITPHRLQRWVRGERTPAPEMLPAIRLHLLAVLAVAGVREGHPTGTGEYTRRAARGNNLRVDEPAGELQ
jgi:transcriptional regulator with XRE-family HTH domain